MDILKALQEVLKKSVVHTDWFRGLNEVVKALDRGQVQLCILASDCDEPRYTRLIDALCAVHEVALVRVPDKKQLGEWAGLCKIDKEEFGESSPGYELLLEYLKESKKMETSNCYRLELP
ncbi:40S ribosomal protein S12 [Gracilariopsis chorda]|uniref:40S ribosomal protein S12 n=1 Tax=Gracilariopsis chorda TaxID=448386 RepID=A0A2V3IBS1_9FLOR|nr:40S ribosomal protein S12 [Gracilariopsis chorda]|eukprot:PXF39549.1 40S ribosomal protein S12 [Gracilariopsis chorda]